MRVFLFGMGRESGRDMPSKFGDLLGMVVETKEKQRDLLLSFP